MSSAVATAFNVTPAQATSASSSISPEHNSAPDPPVAGCSPASMMARPVSTLQANFAVIERAKRFQRDHRLLRIGLVLFLVRGLLGAQRIGRDGHDRYPLEG